MDEQTLELLFVRAADHVRTHALPRFTFYWHGGEPLLQPMRFFERVRDLTEQYFCGVSVTHLLQTNAVLLTKEYAQLLHDCGISVSVSLDGPPQINDTHRVDHAGMPTAKKVLRGIEALQSVGFPTQILCVITPDAIGRGGELYKFFREINTTWMDFLLPHANARHSTIIPHDMPSQEDFADFYIDVYRSWMAEANPKICVRLLRDYVQLILGGRADMCIFGGDCSYIVTVLPDGGIYACDDLLSTFPDPMGSLRTHTLDDIARHENMCKVCSSSKVMFGEECLTCEYFDVCRSGCTNFRATEHQTFTDTYYYCRMSKIVIDYIRKDVLYQLDRAGQSNGVISEQLPQFKRDTVRKHSGTQHRRDAGLVQISV